MNNRSTARNQTQQSTVLTLGQDANLSSIKLHGTIIQCVYLKSNGEILYSLDDVLKLLFNKVNWSPDVKRRKKYSYVKSLQNFNIFLRFCIVDKLPIPFFPNRGVTYFINNLILRHQYPIVDIDALPKFTTDVKQNPKTTIVGADTSYDHATLPKSHYLLREGSTNFLENKNIKKQMFEYDCERLGLISKSQNDWYSNLLCKLSQMMPDVKTLFEYEMVKLQNRENLSYRDLDIKLEYNYHTSWAAKLFMELSTDDKTMSPKRETKIAHDFKKARQRYFCLHLMYHIRNACFSSPLKMTLSDIFYVRHSDVDYSFNMMSRLGVTQSLPTVRKRQTETAHRRNVEEEIKALGNASWTYIWDNFNKTHGSNSVVYGDHHTNSIEVMNRAALALPPTKSCPHEACKQECKTNCFWEKEKPTEDIHFNEIYLNEKEIQAKSNFTKRRSVFFLQETSKIFKQLVKISNEQNINENILAPPKLANSYTVDENIFLKAELNVTLENMKSSLQTRDVIRKLYDINNDNKNSTRIILPSIGGKDTDPHVTYEILQYGLNLFLRGRQNSHRVFIGGDQKTMSLAIRLKKQYEHFNQYYITIPDLHFRKSLMHAILSQYELLGVKHLANLCGYNGDTQWEYLKYVCSIHKPFEFFERLCDSLRIALSFEFYSYLLETKQITSEIISKLDDSLITEIMPLMDDFIQKHSADDQVFQKNVDLLNAAENIISHYTAERTRNWDLRTAALKDSVHFAMISSCTQYGPLLIQLLFHQFSFQERYLDLLKDGYFTFKLRDSNTSAFVGNDAVIEDVNLLAGQFRHKRQTLEQAIDQSNSIDILQKQQKTLDENLQIKVTDCEQIFKDDRETKIRLVRALLHFTSFKNKKRPLVNEFSCGDKKTLNPEVLKTNWYPAADFLIRRFVKQSKSHPMCNIKTAEFTELPQPEITHKLINRIKKSSSIVIGIKAKLKNGTPSEQKEAIVKRKAKQIINQLMWEESNFENAAAICNHDGTKIATNKSKIKNAIKDTFHANVLENSKVLQENKIVLEEKEWYTDYILHESIKVQIKTQTTDAYFVLYPLTVDVLHTILNSKSKVFEKVLQTSHNCIVPLNTESHWVVLFFCGIEQQVYYLDSFGNPPNERILNIVNKKCLFWKTQYNKMKVQFDSYQCGVWCSFFVAVCVDYLNKNQGKTDMNTKHDFMNFFSQTLISKKIIVSTDKKVQINNEFAKSLRISTISKINSSITENCMEIQKQLPQHSTETQFFHEKFPAHIKFDVVSVNSQHSLWNFPTAKNGKEYINFIEKRFVQKYLQTYANKLYWNYDLGDTVKKFVPKSVVHEIRDSVKKEKMDFLQGRLLGEVNLISDTHIVEDWNEIICDRNNRNKVAKYVGASCESMNFQPGKTLIVNSEAVMNGEYSVPQLYHSRNNKTVKINALDLQNTYCEGEGAAVGFIIRNHLEENVIVVSNDTDALFYCLIVAMKRKRINTKFKNEFWLELHYTSKTTGLCGSKKNLVSEFWDINNLIYSIENHLPDVENAVLSLVILYLSAGSDLTEKWYSKTHATFLKRYTTHSSFIGDLINSNGYLLNANSYRKLIHCVWAGENSNPNQLTFDEVRIQTQKRKNVRSRLPEERTILQHFRRVSGAYKYMLNYASSSMEKLDWTNYGFEYDNETKCYYPIIATESTTKNITSETEEKVIAAPKKRSKSITKTKEQLIILEKEFEVSNYLNNKAIANLINATGLTKTQIQDWFSRKRRNNSSEKENIHPSKILRV